MMASTTDNKPELTTAECILALASAGQVNAPELAVEIGVTRPAIYAALARLLSSGAIKEVASRRIHARGPETKFYALP